MTNLEYARKHLDTSLTNWMVACRRAEHFSKPRHGEWGLVVYVLRDTNTEWYKASLDPADLEKGLDCVEVYQNGFILERAF